jgi:hypothetical protein
MGIWRWEVGEDFETADKAYGPICMLYFHFIAIYVLRIFVNTRSSSVNDQCLFVLFIQ